MSRTTSALLATVAGGAAAASLANRRREPESLDGRVVAITGGARGLGLATATALAARGARVGIGDLDGDLAEQVAGELGGSSMGFELDVTEPGSFTRFLDGVERQLGPLDVLVNNAGIMLVGPFSEEEDSLTRRQIDINVNGVITGCRLALPRMRVRGRGHLVNIASAAGKVPVPGEATYVATKHAVVGLSESLRGELKGSGVDISVVMPGLANTELAAGMTAGRGVALVEPEEVADAIVATLERPRFDVYVPSSLRAILAVTLALPRPLREAVARFFQADRIAMTFDAGARAKYAARAAGGVSGSDAKPKHPADAVTPAEA